MGSAVPRATSDQIDAYNLWRLSRMRVVPPTFLTLTLRLVQRTGSQRCPLFNLPSLGFEIHSHKPLQPIRGRLPFHIPRAGSTTMKRMHPPTKRSQSQVEDETTLLPTVLSTVKVEAITDNIKAFCISEGYRSEGSAPPTHHAKRTRFFVDAVVIVRRHPKARLDRHYKPVSSMSARIKGRAPSPRLAAPNAENENIVSKLNGRPRSSSPRQRIKKEAKVKDDWKAKAKGNGKGKQNARGLGHLFDEEFKNMRFKRAKIPEAPFAVGVDQATRDAGAVPRYFMSDTYGGNPNIMCPTPCDEKLAEHGHDDFMFLALDRQPEAPRIPGNHGLWLQIGMGRVPPWEHGIMRLLTRVSNKPALWQYQGQYEVKPSISMTREEWARQSPAVRNKWIGDFHKKDVGGYVRAWIYHRRLHSNTDPTDSEVSCILDNEYDKKVTRDEIAMTFTRGDFTLMVYTLKCVGYDSDFQRQVIAKHSNWTYVPKGKGRKKQTANKEKGGGQPVAEVKGEEDEDTGLEYMSE